MHLVGLRGSTQRPGFARAGAPALAQFLLASAERHEYSPDHP